MKVKQTSVALKDSVRTDAKTAKLIGTKTTVKCWKMYTPRKDMYLYCFSNMFKVSL